MSLETIVKALQSKAHHRRRAAGADDDEGGTLALRRAARLASEESFGLTPLHLAAMANDANAVRLLVSLGADPLALSNPPLCFTPFHCAAFAGSTGALAELLFPGRRGDVKGSNEDAISSLSSPQLGHERLTTGAIKGLTAAHERHGDTPLHVALRAGRWKMAEYLVGVDAGASALTHRNFDGRTPLLVLCRRVFFELHGLVRPLSPAVDDEWRAEDQTAGGSKELSTGVTSTDWDAVCGLCSRMLQTAVSVASECDVVGNTALHELFGVADRFFCGSCGNLGSRQGGRGGSPVAQPELRLAWLIIVSGGHPGAVAAYGPRSTDFLPRALAESLHWLFTVSSRIRTAGWRDPGCNLEGVTLRSFMAQCDIWRDSRGEAKGGQAATAENQRREDVATAWQLFKLAATLLAGIGLVLKAPTGGRELPWGVVLNDEVHTALLSDQWMDTFGSASLSSRPASSAVVQPCTVANATAATLAGSSDSSGRKRTLVGLVATSCLLLLAWALAAPWNASSAAGSHSSSPPPLDFVRAPFD